MPEVIVNSNVAGDKPAGIEEVVTKPVEDTKPLVERVAQFKPEPTTTKPVEEDGKFDVTELASIKTPEEAQAWAQKAYKSMQGDYTRKSQGAADIRKTYEAKMTELSTWTPERVKEVANDPSFRAAAQQISGTQANGADESYLSDADKKQLQTVQTEIQRMGQQNATLLKQQQDQTLSSKYATYDPNAVDTITNDMFTGKYQATREDIFKVIDYTTAQERAYELGKKDALTDNNDKITSISPQGIETKATHTPVAPEKGETSASVWERCKASALKKHAGGAGK